LKETKISMIELISLAQPIMAKNGMTYAYIAGIWEYNNPNEEGYRNQSIYIVSGKDYKVSIKIDLIIAIVQIAESDYKKLDGNLCLKTLTI